MFDEKTSIDNSKKRVTFFVSNFFARQLRRDTCPVFHYLRGESSCSNIVPPFTFRGHFSGRRLNRLICTCFFSFLRSIREQCVRVLVRRRAYGACAVNGEASPERTRVLRSARRKQPRADRCPFARAACLEFHFSLFGSVARAPLGRREEPR